MRQITTNPSLSANYHAKSLGQHSRKNNEKTLIVAVETSGRNGSVAIGEGRNLLQQINFSAPFRHDAELLNSIRDMLKKYGKNPRQIDQLYISTGPGSFTGLRIAVTLAKITSLAGQTKIVAVDTLDIIAQNASEAVFQSNAKIRDIATILDAKRGLFFVAAYQRKNQTTQNETSKINWEKSLSDSLLTPKEFLKKFEKSKQPVYLLGEGLLYHASKFQAGFTKLLQQKYWTPSADKVYLLGRKKAAKNQFADPLTLTPNYIQRPDIRMKTK